MLPVKRQGHIAPKKGAFARARERFNARQEEQEKKEQEEQRREARIGFVIDATGSREDTWEQAQGIQAQMFRAVAGLPALHLRLVHFGGGEVRDHGWMDRPRDVATAMARVKCVTGLTQILPALRTFLFGTAEERPHALILIGDFFEEDMGEVAPLGAALKAAGIKVFSFLEGDDWTAETAFRQLATTTGGRFAKFGTDLPLADLCEGAALLAAGGEKAVARLGNKRVRQLLLTGPVGKS